MRRSLVLRRNHLLPDQIKRPRLKVHPVPHKRIGHQKKLFEYVGKAERVLKENLQGLTKTAIRDKAGIGARWIDEVIKTMLDQGRAEPCQVRVGNYTSTTDGYRYPPGRGS